MYEIVTKNQKYFISIFITKFFIYITPPYIKLYEILYFSLVDSFFLYFCKKINIQLSKILSTILIYLIKIIDHDILKYIKFR